MGYVYRYINNETGKVVYVGKVQSGNGLRHVSLIRRHHQHYKDDWFKEIGSENLRLEYIATDSHADADILETYYINKYVNSDGCEKNIAKTKWGLPSLDIDSLVGDRWQVLGKEEIESTSGPGDLVLRSDVVQAFVSVFADDPSALEKAIHTINNIKTKNRLITLDSFMENEYFDGEPGDQYVFFNKGEPHIGSIKDDDEECNSVEGDPDELFILPFPIPGLDLICGD